jgi:hypothetical protein
MAAAIMNSVTPYFIASEKVPRLRFVQTIEKIMHANEVQKQQASLEWDFSVFEKWFGNRGILSPRGQRTCSNIDRPLSDRRIPMRTANRRDREEIQR